MLAKQLPNSCPKNRCFFQFFFKLIILVARLYFSSIYLCLHPVASRTTQTSRKAEDSQSVDVGYLLYITQAYSLCYCNTHYLSNYWLFYSYRLYRYGGLLDGKKWQMRRLVAYKREESNVLSNKHVSGKLRGRDLRKHTLFSDYILFRIYSFTGYSISNHPITIIV